VLQNAVNLDLPIDAYEMPSVRRDDLDSVTVVGELGRRGHFAIRVDVEIWRLLRHRDFLSAIRLVEAMRGFSVLAVLPGAIALRRIRTDHALLRRRGSAYANDRKAHCFSPQILGYHAVDRLENLAKMRTP
jgi:hypothetical protein